MIIAINKYVLIHCKTSANFYKPLKIDESLKLMIYNKRHETAKTVHVCKRRNLVKLVFFNCFGKFVLDEYFSYSIIVCLGQIFSFAQIQTEQ